MAIRIPVPSNLESQNSNLASPVSATPCRMPIPGPGFRRHKLWIVSLPRAAGKLAPVAAPPLKSKAAALLLQRLRCLGPPLARLRAFSPCGNIVQPISSK